MLEEERNTFAIVRAPAGFGQLEMIVSNDFQEVRQLDITYSGRDVDRHNPITQLLLLLVGNSVGADHLLKLAVVDLVDRVAAEDTMGHNRNGSGCAVLDDHVGCFAEGSAGVCHVVDDDSCATLDVTDQDHAADLVGTSTLLVDERELDVEAVGDCGCSVICFVS